MAVVHMLARGYNYYCGSHGITTSRAFTDDWSKVTCTRCLRRREIDKEIDAGIKQGAYSLGRTPATK